MSDRALTEPVTITRTGRDRLVLISAEEVERLRRASRRPRTIEELSEAEVAEIAKAHDERSPQQIWMVGSPAS